MTRNTLTWPYVEALSRYIRSTLTTLELVPERRFAERFDFKIADELGRYLSDYEFGRIDGTPTYPSYTVSAKQFDVACLMINAMLAEVGFSHSGQSDFSSGAARISGVLRTLIEAHDITVERRGDLAALKQMYVRSKELRATWYRLPSSDSEYYPAWIRVCEGCNHFLTSWDDVKLGRTIQVTRKDGPSLYWHQQCK